MTTQPPVAPLDSAMTPAETRLVPVDVSRLVIAARIVAYEDQSPEALKVLDIAAEKFAGLVPWEDEPETLPPSEDGAGELVAAEQIMATLAEEIPALDAYDEDELASFEATIASIIRAAPRAQPKQGEASGSEQLKARATHGEYSLHNFPDDPDADHSVWSIFHTTDSGGLEVASGMDRATADLLLAALRPQPSEEIGAAVQRVEALSLGGIVSDVYGAEGFLRPDHTFRGDLRAILALIRPAPVAGEGEQ